MPLCLCLRRESYQMQAQDLERVRQNQQRSRERKRAYVTQLEQKIAQLTAQIESGDAGVPSGNEDLVKASNRLRSENDARRQLLLSLGVTAPAQELYIQNHPKRLAHDAPTHHTYGQGEDDDLTTWSPLAQVSCGPIRCSIAYLIMDTDPLTAA